MSMCLKQPLPCRQRGITQQLALYTLCRVSTCNSSSAAKDVQPFTQLYIVLVMRVSGSGTLCALARDCSIPPSIPQFMLAYLHHLLYACCISTLVSHEQGICSKRLLTLRKPVHTQHILKHLAVNTGSTLLKPIKLKPINYSAGYCAMDRCCVVTLLPTNHTHHS